MLIPSFPLGVQYKTIAQNRPQLVTNHNNLSCQSKTEPNIRGNKSVRTSMPHGSRLVDIDPLLVLLQQYRAERKAFDDAGHDGLTQESWEEVARTTWIRTQDQIIESEPAATTAVGALLALDHVLQSDDVFADRSECADLQMIWLLIKAARDYIASLKIQERPPLPVH